MALVVIDMQTDFGCHNSTVDAVIKEIRRAISRGETIWNVTFNDCGKTIWRVQQELRKSSKLYRIRKNNCGGGKELARAMQRNGFMHRLRHVRFVGIYEDACVLETAVEFGKETKNSEIQISVLRHACELGSSRLYAHDRKRAARHGVQFVGDPSESSKLSPTWEELDRLL